MTGNEITFVGLILAICCGGYIYGIWLQDKQFKDAYNKNKKEKYWIK